jgi:hypothetical protein
MHDSAQTHTHTHTHTSSVKHVVLQTAPATWDRAALCSLYKSTAVKAFVPSYAVRPCFCASCTSFKKRTWKPIEVFVLLRQGGSSAGTSSDGQH